MYTFYVIVNNQIHANDNFEGHREGNMIEQIEKTKETKKKDTIEYQTIYINMDDSGVLHQNDSYCVYGGIVLLGKEARDKFIRQYKSILNGIKCDYCQIKKANCSHKCPEIKHSNIYPYHKRRLYNLIKKTNTFAIVINNHKVNENIMSSKSSRGRFRDYCQRRIIKEILQSMLSKNLIDPYKPTKLIIRIDQQGTSTDTNRAFTYDIQHELTDGIYNVNYDLVYPKIIYSKLKIDLKYVVSNNHVCIQASDLIAGKVRSILLSNRSQAEKKEALEIIDNLLFLP